jgi:hypothetical protein
MADPISRQLDSIQSMLVRGQRNLRMERHSLILWGLAGAGCSLSSDCLHRRADPRHRQPRGGLAAACSPLCWAVPALPTGT